MVTATKDKSVDNGKSVDLSSKAAVLMALSAGTITADQASAALDKIQGPAKASPVGKLVIKKNKSGGLYVTSPMFKCWSERLSKVYTGGINFDAGVAIALWADTPEAASLRADIVKAVKDGVLTADDDEE